MGLMAGCRLETRCGRRARLSDAQSWSWSQLSALHMRDTQRRVIQGLVHGGCSGAPTTGRVGSGGAESVSDEREESKGKEHARHSNSASNRQSRCAARGHKGGTGTHAQTEPHNQAPQHVPHVLAARVVVRAGAACSGSGCCGESRRSRKRRASRLIMREGCAHMHVAHDLTHEYVYGGRARDRHTAALRGGRGVTLRFTSLRKGGRQGSSHHLIVSWRKQGATRAIVWALVATSHTERKKKSISRQ